MNRDELKTILPHREPMLLVDEAMEEEGVAFGRYTVRGDEFFLQGHFPGFPVVPGVILCEMMAQTTCVLLGGGEAASGKVTTFFTGLDKVKFRRPVRPGDTITFRCQITRQKSSFYFAKGEGRVEGELAVSGEYSFALVPVQPN